MAHALARHVVSVVATQQSVVVTQLCHDNFVMDAFCYQSFAFWESVDLCDTQFCFAADACEHRDV